MMRFYNKRRFFQNKFKWRMKESLYSRNMFSTTKLKCKMK